MKIHRTRMGCIELQAHCYVPRTSCSNPGESTVSEVPTLQARPSNASGEAPSPLREHGEQGTVQPINWPQMNEYLKWQELDILASDRLEGLSGGLAWRAARFS